MITCFEIDHHTDHEDRIYIQKQLPKGEIFLTKFPGDLMVIKPFLTMMPELKVICMMRDPRDVIVSKHGSAKDQYWCSLRAWHTSIKHHRKIGGHPQMLTVHYEDLVQDPDAVQEKIQQFMPFLKKKHPFSEYHQHANPSSDSNDALRGVRPINTSSIGNWKNHLPRVAGQLKQHKSITQDLIDQGYEKDDSWLKLLGGVEPDLSPSFHWDDPSIKRQLKMWRRRTRNLLKFKISRWGYGLHRLAKWI